MVSLQKRKRSQKMMKIDIGIPEAQRVEIAKGLSKVLADTYTLYLKTHNFHWNVEGPMFNTLHLMFEGQYTELQSAVDVLAERIRSLGARSPGSYVEFKELTVLSEADKSGTSAEDMVKQLLKDHEAVAKTVREAFPAAEKGNDEATKDLLTQRLQLHEKTAWMLRAMAS
jgi:starvation-inducible DNA-binding protein